MILLVASAPTHLSLIVGPLARMYGWPVVRSHALCASRTGEELGPCLRHYSWPALRFWDRRAWLRAACRRALRVHQPDAVIVTSARYHLEQAFLEVAPEYNVKRIVYFSTAFMEASFKDGQRDHGPRMQFYDVGDELWTIGDHLRDQLIEHGVNPARIRVMGSPASLEMYYRERAYMAVEALCSLV